MTTKKKDFTYKNTGFGRPTGPRKPRPATDSLPRHECAEDGCGKPGVTSPFVLSFNYQAIGFCSWGCLSRFAIIQEIRQP